MKIDSECLDKLTQLLGEIIKTVSILTIAAKLTEASSEEERICLSQALSCAVQGDSGNRINGSSTSSGGLEFPRNFP